MTTGRQIQRPRIPEAPEDYDKNFMDQLIRALQLFMDRQNDLGFGRFSELTLTNVQGSAGGKEVGYVYQEGGTLKIVLSDDILAPSLVVNTRLGTVAAS